PAIAGEFARVARRPVQLQSVRGRRRRAHGLTGPELDPEPAGLHQLAAGVEHQATACGRAAPADLCSVRTRAHHRRLGTIKARMSAPPGALMPLWQPWILRSFSAYRAGSGPPSAGTFFIHASSVGKPARS